MLTQMHVRGLMFDPYTNAYIIILRDDSNTEMLPIWVGKPEASAISFAMEGIATPRPMTHDLMKTVLDTADAKVISVVVTDLKKTLIMRESISSMKIQSTRSTPGPAMRLRWPCGQRPLSSSTTMSSASTATKRWTAGWRISSPRTSASLTRDGSSVPFGNSFRDQPQSLR
jgi:hypothetical protein